MNTDTLPDVTSRIVRIAESDGRTLYDFTVELRDVGTPCGKGTVRLVVGADPTRSDGREWRFSAELEEALTATDHPALMFFSVRQATLCLVGADEYANGRFVREEHPTYS